MTSMIDMDEQVAISDNEVRYEYKTTDELWELRRSIFHELILKENATHDLNDQLTAIRHILLKRMALKGEAAS